MRQRGSNARLTEQPGAALALIKYVVFCLQLALARNTVHLGPSTEHLLPSERGVVAREEGV